MTHKRCIGGGGQSQSIYSGSSTDARTDSRASADSVISEQLRTALANDATAGEKQSLSLDDMPSNIQQTIYPQCPSDSLGAKLKYLRQQRPFPACPRRRDSRLCCSQGAMNRLTLSDLSGAPMSSSDSQPQNLSSSELCSD